MPAEEDCEEMEFATLWIQHGGSGLNITRTEYLDLDVPHRNRLLDRIGEQREAEAKEIEEASK